MDKTHGETHKQLEKYQRDITRRLLTLDGMMGALETLLVRTEPPQKEPSWMIKIIKSIAKFFMSIGRFMRSIWRWVIKPRFRK